MTAPRRTIADLRQAERVLNRVLAISGTATRYLAQGRNGYTGIDRYRADDIADGDVDAGRGRWHLRATLAAPLTVAEAAIVLEAMADAVEHVTAGAIITR